MNAKTYLFAALLLCLVESAETMVSAALAFDKPQIASLSSISHGKNTRSPAAGGMNMPGMNIAGMNMSETSMPGMNMPGMNMSGMSMPGMNTQQTSMPGMKMPETGTTPPQTLMPQGHLEVNDSTRKNAKSYNLDDLEKLAEQNNPTLIQAQAQIKGEKGKALQAGIWPNPSLGYRGDLMGLPTAGAGEFQGGSLGQEIILGGKLKYSRRKYEARTAAAEQQAVAQRWRVKNDVKTAFLQALGSAQKLQLEEEMLKSVKDMWLTAKEMHNMGQANQISLRAANIELELEKAKVIAAQNELQYAWQVLMTVVGIDAPYGGLQGKLDENPTDLSFDSALQKLLADSPELGEAKAKLKSDEITLQREHRQPVPNVTLSGGAGYDQLDRGVAAVAGVNVTNIPLFNRNQGTIQQAEADLARQKAQVKLVELNLKRRLAEHFNAYKTSIAFVRAYRDVAVPQTREKYEIALESYKDTRLEWPAVLEAQRDYIKARTDYVRHLVACQQSAVEINGFLLSGGLVPPPGVTPPGHIDATPQPR